MAFDETLADRVRAIIRTDPTVSEKRMFGGLAFLASGNMSVGVQGTELIVRVGPAEGVTLLNQPGVRVFDIRGRPMKGWLLVAATSVPDQEKLSAWIALGLSYAKSLPPK